MPLASLLPDDDARILVIGDGMRSEISLAEPSFSLPVRLRRAAWSGVLALPRLRLWCAGTSPLSRDTSRLPARERERRLDPRLDPLLDPRLRLRFPGDSPRSASAFAFAARSSARFCHTSSISLTSSSSSSSFLTRLVCSMSRNASSSAVILLFLSALARNSAWSSSKVSARASATSSLFSASLRAPTFSSITSSALALCFAYTDACCSISTRTCAKSPSRRARSCNAIRACACAAARISSCSRTFAWSAVSVAFCASTFPMATASASSMVFSRSVLLSVSSSASFLLCDSNAATDLAASSCASIAAMLCESVWIRLRLWMLSRRSASFDSSALRRSFSKCPRMCPMRSKGSVSDSSSPSPSLLICRCLRSSRSSMLSARFCSWVVRSSESWRHPCSSNDMLCSSSVSHCVWSLLFLAPRSRSSTLAFSRALSVRPWRSSSFFTDSTSLLLFVRTSLSWRSRSCFLTMCSCRRFSAAAARAFVLPASALMSRADFLSWLRLMDFHKEERRLCFLSPVGLAPE
mmetsp:Transcript_39206/g.122676  ORF Transcript_39206/g.122676 Transcript_39206/m.122676 type:complete len:522 (-) Transcript_39206:319-1884(-)